MFSFERAQRYLSEVVEGMVVVSWRWLVGLCGVQVEYLKEE